MDELEGLVEAGRDVLEAVFHLQDELGQVVAAGDELVDDDLASPTAFGASQAQFGQLKKTEGK